MSEHATRLKAKAKLIAFMGSHCIPPEAGGDRRIPHTPFGDVDAIDGRGPRFRSSANMKLVS